MRIKINLDVLLDLTVTSTIELNFSISNNENFISTYETAYGMGIEKTTTTTTVTIYAGGGSSAKVDDAILGISATGDYVITDVDPDLMLNSDFLKLVVDGVFSFDFDGKTGMILYRLNSPRNKVNKSIIYVDYMRGTFKAPLGIKNIEIDVENYQIDASYNYIYLPKLKRYYFITNVQFLNKDYTRLILQEDVLMTWKELIKQQKAFVERCANALYYDLYIEDPEIKLDYQKRLDIETVLSSFTSSFYIPDNTPFILTVVRK